jgi:hypothetical protein
MKAVSPNCYSQKTTMRRKKTDGVAGKDGSVIRLPFTVRT